MQQYCLQKKTALDCTKLHILKTLPTSTNKSDIIKIFWLQQLHLDTVKKEKKPDVLHWPEEKKKQKIPNQHRRTGAISFHQKGPIIPVPLCTYLEWHKHRSAVTILLWKHCWEQGFTKMKWKQERKKKLLREHLVFLASVFTLLCSPFWFYTPPCFHGVCFVFFFFLNSSLTFTFSSRNRSTKYTQKPNLTIQHLSFHWVNFSI